LITHLLHAIPGWNCQRRSRLSCSSATWR
jgi:hypothetical protein